MIKKIMEYFSYSIVAGNLSACALAHKLPVITHNSNYENISSRLRVMTANVARGEGTTNNPLTQIVKKPVEGFTALEDLIQKENIDLGCFQEIENTLRQEDQSKRIADNTALKNYVFGPNYGYSLFDNILFADGNAIASRYPLHESRRGSLEILKPFGYTAIIDAFLGTKGFLHSTLYYQGMPINVLCTHLSNRETQNDERSLEMQALFEYAAQHTPAIIMGDFNTVPLSSHRRTFGSKSYKNDTSWDVVQEVLKRYDVMIQADPRLELFDREAEQNFPGTWMGRVPDGKLGKKRLNHSDSGQTIDYILILTHKDDAIHLKLENTRVIRDKYYSDHAPVIGRIMVERK